MSGLSALSAAEVAFAARMAFHIDRGLSLVDAARAVVADDARLVTAFFDRGQSMYFPTADERGRSHHSGSKRGDMIGGHISQMVYAKLRAPSPSAGS